MFPYSSKLMYPAPYKGDNLLLLEHCTYFLLALVALGS